MRSGQGEEGTAASQCFRSQPLTSHIQGRKYSNETRGKGLIHPGQHWDRIFAVPLPTPPYSVDPRELNGPRAPYDISYYSSSRYRSTADRQDHHEVFTQTGHNPFHEPREQVREQ